MWMDAIVVLAPLLVGALGTGLERLGFVKVGQALEAVSVDIPKLLGRDRK